MTSQGQRFRRRALRRGYKVDEVDGFLDRVEATIAGEPIDAPVTAQEVHDVVFRVRFGGYDEWQVDLHLDRVERQLAEAAQPGPGYGPGPDPRNGGRPPERMGPPPERMGPPPERMGPPPGSLGHGPPPGAGPHGPGPHGPGGGPVGAPMPAQAGPPPGAYPDADYDRYDEPTYGGYDGREPARPGMINTGADRFGSDMTSEMRLGDPGGPPMPRPGPPDPGPAGPGMGGPGMGGRGGAGGPGMGGPGGHGMAGHEGPGGPGGNGPGMGHDGPGPRGPGGPPAGPPMAGPSSPGFGPASPGFGPSGPGFGPGMDGPEEAPRGDVQRLDQLRRTFQPRRFGSGDDRSQVDRLFEEVMAGVSGQGPMSVSDTDLDPGRFDLVPGGYFEAEVEQALHEVRDILRRQ